jgi:hypothetical protein
VLIRSQEGILFRSTNTGATWKKVELDAAVRQVQISPGMRKETGDRRKTKSEASLRIRDDRGGRSGRVEI